MALTKGSLFLYGFQVTSLNNYVDFRAASLGPELSAVLRQGYYSLTALMQEIVRAMNAADPNNIYSYSIDRTLNGGTENRVTISTDGAYLDLLFGSGTHSTISCAPLIGFSLTDKTGATSYQSTSTAGTVLQPTLTGYTYVPTTMQKRVIGSVNIAASGEKEVVTFATHQFFNVEFKYEPQAKVISEWQDLVDWMINGRLFEFTPDITDPNTVVDCTLEKTGYDSKGLGFMWREMLPDFPFLYQTGVMTFRKRPAQTSYTI